MSGSEPGQPSDGASVQAWLRDLGLSQAELARLVGLSERAVARQLSRAGRPRPAVLSFLLAYTIMGTRQRAKYRRLRARLGQRLGGLAAALEAGESRARRSEVARRISSFRRA